VLKAYAKNFFVVNRFRLMHLPDGFEPYASFSARAPPFALQSRGICGTLPRWRRFNQGDSVRLLRYAVAALLFLGANSALLALQRNSFPFAEDDEDNLPTNTNQKAEWVFARFHYDPGGAFGYGYRGFQRWAADYPKSDRQFVMGVRRLTRLDTRPIEEVVDANSDDIFNWPWIFVEDPGAWHITEPQAKRLRDYLLRGGFLVLDDTHGEYEWETMLAGMNLILPGRPIEDLPDNDEIFHVLYDLDNRFQIPGTRFIWGQRTYSADMRVPRWRAIRDDQGRIMVAIWHNSDVGDAWEWADSPRYPSDALFLAYKLGINYIIYGMTH
jgi:hypothetical protein